MTPEGRVVAYLVKRCKEERFEVRKVSWEGRRFAPDRLILGHGAAAFVELKAPGKHPTAGQTREFLRMQQAGLAVFVCDDFAQVDQVIEWVSETGIRNEARKTIQEERPLAGRTKH